MQYSIADLYPNMYPTDTTDTTIPERAEQMALNQSDVKRPETASSGEKRSLWIGLAILAAVIIFLSL